MIHKSSNPSQTKTNAFQAKKIYNAGTAEPLKRVTYSIAAARTWKSLEIKNLTTNILVTVVLTGLDIIRTLTEAFEANGYIVDGLPAIKSTTADDGGKLLQIYGDVELGVAKSDNDATVNGTIATVPYGVQLQRISFEGGSNLDLSIDGVITTLAGPFTYGTTTAATTRTAFNTPLKAAGAESVVVTLDAVNSEYVLDVVIDSSKVLKLEGTSFLKIGKPYQEFKA